MLIEIHGAGFQNKGAELMLRTAVSELRSRIENFVPAIDPGYGSYESRCDLKLRQIIPPRGHVGKELHGNNLQRQALYSKIKFDSLLRKILGIKLDTYGCVAPHRIDALIDISGFAYTEQWGSRPTKDFANLAEFYRKNKKPVIMLPQAFGPFESEEIKADFKRIIDNVTLIFPRDEISYRYVSEICSAPEKIIQAPDITIFHPRKSIKHTVEPDHYVCLVPNARMLDQGNEQWGSKYEKYFLSIAQEIQNSGLQIYIVVHDTSGQDHIIANRLIKELNSKNICLVEEPDPYKLKEIIGKSKMVVGSRYHSLVASISQTVPAIAIGWSHKYEMLFKDFGLEDFIVGSETTLEDIFEKVRKLCTEEINISLREKIAKNLSYLEAESFKMWSLVEEVLNI